MSDSYEKKPELSSGSKDIEVQAKEEGEEGEEGEEEGEEGEEGEELKTKVDEIKAKVEALEAE